jgi:hypothetical protein
LPELQVLHDEYAKLDFAVVAVIERGSARAVKSRFGVTYPVLHTGTHLYGYWIIVSPEGYVLDREHRFVASLRGRNSWTDAPLRELLDLVLGRLQRPARPVGPESP